MWLCLFLIVATLLALAIPPCYRRTRVTVLMMIVFAGMYGGGNAATRRQLLLGSPGLTVGTVTSTYLNGPGSTGYPSQNYQEWSTICTADADTGTGSISHVMGAYAKGILNPMVGAASPAASQLSLWCWNTGYPSATAFSALKATTAGSGNAGVNLRTRIERAG